MPIERPHVIVAPRGERFQFSVKSSGGRPNHPPDVEDRAENSARILDELRTVVAAARDLSEVDAARIPISVRANSDWGVAKTIPGRRNDVLSTIGFKSAARLNIALDADTLKSFESAAKRYVKHTDGARRPGNFDFFEARPTLVMSEVRDFWASELAIPGEDEDILWEVWMPRASEPRFREALEELDLSARRAMRFGHLRVVAVEATRADFERLVRSGAIAQLKPASSLTSELIGIPGGVQQAAVEAASRRITPAPASAPAVCLLDTGIRADHPLLRTSVDLADSVSAGDGSDWSGHGTKMAGLALFDDLPGLVGSNGAEAPTIRLESVLVQPAMGIPDVRLPAERLSSAVDIAEERALRPRRFCLAMSALDEGSDGGVASLSSEVDRLAAELGAERLFCVPAGNLSTPTYFGDYQVLNETSGLATPAQAWNALTIAACTDLDRVPATHGSLAPAGDLSPWSRTSCAWDRSHKPPLKPDVVFEGGNQMYDQVSQDLSHHADLCLLTTSAEPNSPLTLTGMTSAATASISGMCARLQAAYPELWPETIRGLIVHSSEYSDAMLERAKAAAPIRGSMEAALLERFGYGRPLLSRAIENAEDSLTFITQGALLPLRSNSAETGTILGYMRQHDLPWPEDVLLGLGDTPAELRVTLSYFIEPNPGAVLVGQYDQYASHGYDFDVKRPDESEEQAVARINGAVTAHRKSTAKPLKWFFGSKERGGPMSLGARRGCLKHDRVTMPAEDLARSGSIMVFPRKGWWGSDYDRIDQQARYSLIVSIRTPEEEIYTEIVNSIEI